MTELFEDDYRNARNAWAGITFIPNASSDSRFRVDRDHSYHATLDLAVAHRATMPPKTKERAAHTFADFQTRERRG